MQARPFGDELAAAVRKYLHDNSITQRHLTGEILADIGQRFYDHYETQKKARKKRGDATEEEIAIYDTYPRHIARADALVAIRAARERVDAARLLAATARYSACVVKWPRAYRYPEGRDLVPHPATWFNRQSYLDDPKEWMPPGIFQREDDPVSKMGSIPPQPRILEPSGWREQIKDHETLAIFVGRDWNTINEHYKKQIAAFAKMEAKVGQEEF